MIFASCFAHEQQQQQQHCNITTTTTTTTTTLQHYNKNKNIATTTTTATTLQHYNNITRKLQHSTVLHLSHTVSGFTHTLKDIVFFKIFISFV